MEAVVVDPAFSCEAVFAGSCVLCRIDFAEDNNGDGTVDLVRLQTGEVLHSRCFLSVYSDDPSDYEWMESNDGDDEGIGNSDNDSVHDGIEDPK